jgi:hypothetical protein
MEMLNEQSHSLESGGNHNSNSNTNYKKVSIDLKEEFIMNNNRKVKIKQVNNKIYSNLIFLIFSKTNVYVVRVYYISSYLVLKRLT